MPEDVTHFNFWSKWPRPFFPVLDRVLEAGFPVLWNVSITGLGGTRVEPRVPPVGKAVVSAIELSRLVPPAAIQWRYDPIFLSETHRPEHHVERFRRLAERLAGHVDRVATSFLDLYRNRVKPDVIQYGRETGDSLKPLSPDEKVELLERLREIAEETGLPFTLCCQPPPA